MMSLLDLESEIFRIACTITTICVWIATMKNFHIFFQTVFVDIIFPVTSHHERGIVCAYKLFTTGWDAYQKNLIIHIWLKLWKRPQIVNKAHVELYPYGVADRLPFTFLYWLMHHSLNPAKQNSLWGTVTSWTNKSWLLRECCYHGHKICDLLVRTASWISADLQVSAELFLCKCCVQPQTESIN